MKTLVVDDDDLIRELLCEILGAFGYTDITQAESGDDALAKIAAAPTPFDCFMLDIQMPDMDGIELCSRVRAIPQYRESPIVMITAMSQKSYIDRAFQAGATDYVTKPFDTTELMARVKLADRLQTESRRVRDLMAKSATHQPAAAAKPAFSQPVAVSEVRGFVNEAILKNYVQITMAQKAFPLAAIAVKVPELEFVHSGASSEEFAYVLMDMADVLCDLFVGSNAFMSYVGSGTFLCVGNKKCLPDEKTLEENLLVLLNDEDLVFCNDVQTSFSVRVGERVGPKMFSTGTNMTFLEQAIDNLSPSNTDRTKPRSGWLSKRLLVSEAA